MLTEWIGKEANQIFNNNPQRSRLTGRPKNRWWNCTQIRKVTNWKERSKKRVDWGQYIKEAKVRTGL